MEMKLDAVTASNVAEGELERQLQARLAELVPVFADPRPFVKTKDGGLEAKIKFEMIFSLDTRTGSLIVAVGSETVRPKLMRAARAIYRRGAQFFTGKEQVQEKLVLRDVSSPEPHEVEVVPAAASAKE